MLVPVHHLVGVQEIRAILNNVSRQRINQLARRKDFPEPVVKLGMGKVWNRADVEEWAQSHGRVINEAEGDEREG